jgi:hypothetical protein
MLGSLLSRRLSWGESTFELVVAVRFEFCAIFTVELQPEGRLPILNSKRSNLRTMTNSKKALMAGAALAGLLAGSAATIQASNLLPGLKSSISAQDQSQDQQDQKADKKVKEKHACKGQNSCKGKGGCKSSDNGCKGKNSCKGKGGCATDGSKPPAE